MIASFYKKYRTRRLIQSLVFVTVSIMAILYMCRKVLQIIEDGKHLVDGRFQGSSLAEIPPDALYVSSKTKYFESVPGLQYSLQSMETALDDLQLFPLVDLLEAWNPDDVSPQRWMDSKAHPSNHQSIPRFDYSDPEQSSLAKQRRDLELPFIV